MKVAVLRFSALGDLASLRPYLLALSERPVLITTPMGVALYEDDVDRFLVLKSKTWQNHLSLIREVRRERFDLLIDMQQNDRSRLVRTLSGARKVIARRPEDLSSLGVIWQQMLAPSGLLRAPDMSFAAKPRNYVVLNMGSSQKWLSKRLPDAKWVEIASFLHGRFGLPFLLTGDASERAYVERLATLLPGRTENKAGQTDLNELKRLLQGAFLTVSTDSAAMHLSASMKTPTIGIFGATNWQKSGPVGPWTRAVYDHTYYPGGVPPSLSQTERRAYYEHVDVSEAVESLMPYLSLAV